MSKHAPASTTTYGGYADLLGEASLWTIGRFPLPGNRFWEMREPEAVAIVREGNLQIGVQQLSRFNDRSQILDNAKHVLFATQTIPAPKSGGVAFELDMKVQRKGAREGDLYDGYGSFLCLDFSSGTAIDWFVAEDMCASTYARLPFPGLELQELEGLNYWALFQERKLDKTPAGFHTFRIEVTSEDLAWFADGEERRREKLRYELGDLTLGLAIMTEKDIGPHGSVSLHGQGVLAEWSPITISTW